MRVTTGIAIGIVVLLLIFLVMIPRKTLVNTGATLQALSPAAYQSEFAQTGQPHLLIDVRTPEEFASGHIAGAQNIPLQELPNRLGELPQDQPIVLYCRSGNRSGQAMQLLAKAGYDHLYNLGGVIEWQTAGLPLR